MNNNLGNKKTLADNLQYYMDRKGIDRNGLSEALNVPYTTITDWLKGKTYPRIDKIELMAQFFNVTKSDLIEEHGLHYLDPEVAELAQRVYDDPDLRILFDASRDVSKEDMQYVIDLVTRLKNNGEL